MIKNTLIILTCSITAKLLSYVWEAVIASFLGISENADAFYMVSGIFMVLYPILDLGIWKVFLPIYKQKLALGNYNKAERIANISITLFFCFSIALVIFFIFFAQPLILLMAPGFDMNKKVIAIEYLRISAFAYLLMAIASIIGAMLQSHERFLGSQVREIGTHLSKIIFVLVFYNWLGIYAAVTAIIVGSIFRLIVQIPFINWKWNFKFDFSFRNADIIPMLKGLPSVAVTAAILQINGMVGRMFASASATGSVACLNYGNKLLNVFSGMISSAIATATYPTIIQYAAKKETEKLSALISNIMAVLSFLIIPLSFFCFFFSNDIVQVAFQRGAFNQVATRLTASVFAGYCIGMFFIGMSTILSNIFYAFGDVKITLHISIIDIILNLLFIFLLYPQIGIVGIALSTSLSAVLSLFIRFYFLKYYIKIDYNDILSELGKVVLISMFTVYSSYYVLTKFFQVSVIVRLVCGSLITFVVYLLLTLLFKLKALNNIKRFIISRIKNKL